jgi:hypothetical protein
VVHTVVPVAAFAAPRFLGAASPPTLRGGRGAAPPPPRPPALWIIFFKINIKSIKMGFSSKFFAEYRDERRQENEAEKMHEYFESNTYEVSSERAKRDREEDAKADIEAANKKWQLQELARVQHELKYFRGNDAEKFFALKVYLKQLSELKRA